MELRQLRYLVALTEERSFTRAAAREHVAQPALSQQIQKLEREIGLALVERTTRRVSITDAGEMLVARARRILGELEAAREEMQSLRGLLAGRVNIGAMHTMGQIDISLALATFHERHPEVELTVREDYSESLAEMVRTDEIDLAFLSVTERIEGTGLALHQLTSEELVVVLPPHHLLADREEIRMLDLANEQFISFRHGARLRELLETAAASVGFKPDIRLESNEIHRVRSLVSRGLGVAILPESDVATTGTDVAIRRLINPSLARDITLAWRQDRRHPPAVAEFLKVARDTLAITSSRRAESASFRR